MLYINSYLRLKEGIHFDHMILALPLQEGVSLGGRQLQGLLDGGDLGQKLLSSSHGQELSQ